jgi:hypothetical protein
MRLPSTPAASTILYKCFGQVAFYDDGVGSDEPPLDLGEKFVRCKIAPGFAGYAEFVLQLPA